jgi:hypothetical protein
MPWLDIGIYQIDGVKGGFELNVYLLLSLTYPRIDGQQRTWDILHICRRTAAAHLQYNMLYTIIHPPIILSGIAIVSSLA